MTVFAAHPWRTNAELIEAVHELGYVTDTDLVLDPTYGNGRWWSKWKPLPGLFIGTDLNPDKCVSRVPVDFTAMPWPDGMFDVVAFDPPYKLNGTPTASVDEQYGVDVTASWRDRHELIRRGMGECARVLKPRGVLLLKCQDQVCGGKVRWQTHEFADWARWIDLELVDELLMLGGRPQPAGRRQVHARRNYSTLLVLRKAGPMTPIQGKPSRVGLEEATRCDVLGCSGGGGNE